MRYDMDFEMVYSHVEISCSALVPTVLGAPDICKRMVGQKSHAKGQGLGFRLGIGKMGHPTLTLG